jgi:hypothetical protein
MSAEKYELDVMTEKYEARCAGMAEGRAEGYKEAEAEYPKAVAVGKRGSRLIS